MKRNIFSAVVATTLLFGLSSCSKETTTDVAPNPEETGRTLSFELPLQGSAITYAGEVAANPDEKALHQAHTRIYMFNDATGTLETSIASANISVATNVSTGKTFATITPGNWTGNKTFFILGNTHKHAAASMTAGITAGMTQSAFMDLVTVSQGGAHLDINSPSPASLLLSGSVQVANVESAVSANVSLYRSVARFDIKNDVTESGVVIESVDVNNANLNGYIVAYGRGVKGGLDIEKGDLPTKTISPATVAGDAAKGENAAHQYQKEESFMYLYPTRLKTDGTGTNIYLTGKVGTETKVFTLNKEVSGEFVDSDIKANTRYIISAIDIKSLTFTITIEDWDEGDVLVGHPGNGTNSFAIAKANTTPTNGEVRIAQNAIRVLAPTGAFSASIKMKGTSTLGMTADVLTTPGAVTVGPDIISVTSPVYDAAGVSYALPYFGYDATISFAAGKIPVGKNFSTIIRFTDVSSGAVSDVRVYYAEGSNETADGTVLFPTGSAFNNPNASTGALPAVKIGSLYWAPVNVGATTINVDDNSQAANGWYYQWGRNVGHWPATFKRVNGPLTNEQIAADNTSVIYVAPDGVNSQDWRVTPLSATMWSGTACPTGWRLPTVAEATSLTTKASGAYGTYRKQSASGNYYVAIPGDEPGEELVFSFTGYGAIATNQVMLFGNSGLFWCSNGVNATNNQVTNFRFTSGAAVIISNQTKNSVLPKRCVKDVE